MHDPDDGPLVSCVLATYNRADDLKEAITSVLEQEYRPLEIVVISDSTDGTDELFEEGGPFDIDRVHYHHFPGRMGVPRARNVGFERAAGEVLLTLDDDAVLLSKHREEFAEHVRPCGPRSTG